MNNNDLQYLQNKLKEYKEYIDGGCNSYDAIKNISKNHCGGWETGEDNQPILLYKGDYILLLGQSCKIYKEIK